MRFVNNTLISPDATAEDIPVIHGQNYYIDEQGIVCTYNLSDVTVIDTTGKDVAVSSIDQITDNIYVINNRLAYKLSTFEILVTSILTSRSVYKGGFQGIVGFNEGDTSYHFLNNKSVASAYKFTGRLNALKHLEILVGDTWYVPNGEFRCYIGDTFYNISALTTLPNSFGDEFDVYLASWTEVNSLTEIDATDYIRDILVQGNTLYLSTRKHLIGSEPFNWNVISTTTASVIWSEDSRFINCKLYGEVSADILFAVDTLSNTIYCIKSEDLTYLNSYEHPYMITACTVIDKQVLVVIDKRFVSLINFYVSLNNYLVKILAQTEFKQMSAYEDLSDGYLEEHVTYVKEINTIGIKSSYRANMMCHLVGLNINSICHTDTEMRITDWNIYYVQDAKVMKYSLVEDNGSFTEISDTVKDYPSFIYIGSDLEADTGGSTLADTQIIFEGKIAIEDERGAILIESSGDKPKSIDYPVRTNQENPANNWFLYSKTLRIPVSYTDWLKISLMPTTRIHSISLVNTLSDNPTKKKKGKQ